MQRQISRRELFLWIIIGFLANHFLHTIDTSSIAGFFQSLASQNLIYWFSCFVIISGLLDSDGKAEASRFDLLMVLTVGILLVISSFIGYRFYIGVLTTLAALYILRLHSTDTSLKTVGTVLLALSVHLIWAPLIYRIFTPELLMADALAVNSVLSAIRPDISLIGTTFTSSGHTVTLVGACSSFQNVSIALLASVTFTMYIRPYWVRSDVYWILAICAAMIAINVVRLGVLAWNRDSYLFWHNGVGMQILALVQTFIVCSISYLGAQYGKHSN